MKIDLANYRHDYPMAIDRTTLAPPHQQEGDVVDGFVLYNPENEDWITTTNDGTVVGYGTADHHAGLFDDNPQDHNHIAWLTSYKIE